MEKPNWQRLRDGEMDWSVFRRRSEILKTIRSFFEAHDFLEVESPIATPFPTLDSNIHSMETRWTEESGKRHSLFLHTSPEHAMKKLLAAGAERIFYLGKVFRDRELTRLHNPEFTMLEWYRTDATYEDIRKNTEELVYHIYRELFSDDSLNYQGRRIDLRPPWDRITLNDLFLREVGFPLEENMTLDALSKSSDAIGIHRQSGDDWETLFFRVFLEKIERRLGFPKPVFVSDYPKCMGLMAKTKKDNPDWTERTELYIAGIEMANGYSELLNADEQRERFRNDLEKKKAEGYDNYIIDEELLDALKSGIPPSAGIALGVDRLVMLFLDKTDIRDVLLFPMEQ